MFEAAALQWSQHDRRAAPKDVVSEQAPITPDFVLELALRKAHSGSDPYTHTPRKNSQAWVRDNEPRPIVDLLERLHGSATLPNTHPLSKPL